MPGSPQNTARQRERERDSEHRTTTHKVEGGALSVSGGCKEIRDRKYREGRGAVLSRSSPQNFFVSFHIKKQGKWRKEFDLV